MATKLIPPPDIKDEVNDGDGAVMGFFEHLEELRVRLFRLVLGLGLGMLISLIVVNPVMAYIASSSGLMLQSLSPTETIGVFFRVTLMLGAILASPYITWQVLMFVVPGLTRNEKKWLALSIPATTALFLFGVVFTWLVLVPAYVSFLNGFQSNVVRQAWTLENYFNFVTWVVFWHGVAFETPILFYILARLGIVSGKKMIKYWRHAMVASAVFAGFIAPTYDPLTMIVITLMLFTLYLFSVALVAFGIPHGWGGRDRSTT